MLSVEPDVGSILWPWDHDLSPNQESDSQPTEPPRHPFSNNFYEFYFKVLYTLWTSTKKGIIKINAFWLKKKSAQKFRGTIPFLLKEWWGRCLSSVLKDKDKVCLDRSGEKEECSMAKGQKPSSDNSRQIQFGFSRTGPIQTGSTVPIRTCLIFNNVDFFFQFWGKVTFSFCFPFEHFFFYFLKNCVSPPALVLSMPCSRLSRRLCSWWWKNHGSTTKRPQFKSLFHPSLGSYHPSHKYLDFSFLFCKVEIILPTL